MRDAQSLGSAAWPFVPIVNRGFRVALAARGTAKNKRKLEHTMITFDAFLVLLGAAMLPVLYIAICSRWIEPEYRKAGWPTPDHDKPQPVANRELAQQAA